jgi:hypothetical protein
MIKFYITSPSLTLTDDPRCRDWYDTGKSRYKNLSQPVHITAPYLFALENSSFIAASATSPVVNPATDKYAGQMLIDFYPSAVRKMLDPLTDYLSFVITPEADLSGGNTVVGPNRSIGWESAPIENYVFEHDSGSPRKAYFVSSILPFMMNGTSGKKQFSRLNEHGREEVWTLAFEPVYARALLPLDPSDFSRGINMSEILVYSVGIAAYSDSIEAPLQIIDDDVDDDLRVLSAIYISIVCFVSLGLVVFTYKVSLALQSGWTD